MQIFSQYILASIYSFLAHLMKEHQDKDSKLMLLKTEFVDRANSILAIAFTKDREKVSTVWNGLNL